MTNVLLSNPAYPEELLTPTFTNIPKGTFVNVVVRRSGEILGFSNKTFVTLVV